MDNNKLWPLEQLLQWLHTCDNSKFSAIPKNTLVTLIALVKFANNETWECSPSYKSLLNVTFQSEDTVILHIKRLESSGIIRVGREARTNNEYKIYPEKLWKQGAFCKLKKKLPVKYGNPSRKIREPFPENTTRTSSLTSCITNKPEISKKYELKPTAQKASSLLEEYEKARKGK